MSLPHEPLWSIITLTVSQRVEQLAKLREEVKKQIGSHPIEHVIQPGRETYRAKMRLSLQKAKGLYVSWIDDDDFIAPNYVKRILEGIYQGHVDVVTLGSATPGLPPCWLRANRKDNSNAPGEELVKTANMYCVWRKEIAAAAPWLPRDYGAEVVWYTALRLAFPNLREHHIHEVIHVYNYSDSTTLAQNRESIANSLAQGGNHVFIGRHKGNKMLLASYVTWRRAYLWLGADGGYYKIPDRDVEILDEIWFR